MTFYKIYLVSDGHKQLYTATDSIKEMLIDVEYCTKTEAHTSDIVIEKVFDHD